MQSAQVDFEAAPASQPQTLISRRSVRRRLPWRAYRAIATAAIPALAALWHCSSLHAQDATAQWTPTATANWNTASNWNGGVVPNNGVPSGTLYIALFSGGTIGNATVNGSFTIDQLNFTGITAAYQLAWGSATDTLTLSAGANLSSIGLLYDSTSTKAVTLYAPLALGSNQAWEFDGSGLVTVGNNANGRGGLSGAFNLTKTGTGSVTFALPNPGYSGQTSVLAGTLTLNGNATYNGNLGTSLLPVLVGNTSGSTGATFALGGTDTFSGNLTVQAGTTGTITLGGTGTTILGSNTSVITLNQSATFDVSSGNSNDVQGQITGVGGILKTSAGALQLDNSNNNFSGALDLRNGTIIVNGNSVLGTSSTAIKLGDGSSATGSNISLLTNGNYIITNNLTDAAAATRTQITSVTIGGGNTQSVSSTYSGNITTSTFASSASTVTQLQSYTSAGNAVTFSGKISGTGGLATTGSGTVALSGPNTYAGGTNVVAGTLQTGATNTLPSGTTVTFGSASTNGTLDLKGNSQQIAGLAVATGASAPSEIITNSGSADATLTYNGGSSIFGGAIQDGRTNKIALTTSGGTLTIDTNGLNSYSGQTGVSASSLYVNGSNTGGGAYSVGNNGFLGGNGSITTGTGASGLTIASGGTLAPGQTAAGQTVGTFHVNGDATVNGTLSINEGANVFSALNASGTLTIAPGSSLQFVSSDNFAGLNGSAYIIATYGSLNGTFGSSVSNLPSGYSLNYNYEGDQIALVDSNSVPEPSSVGLGGIGVAGLLLARRRRKSLDHHKQEG